MNAVKRLISFVFVFIFALSLTAGCKKTPADSSSSDSAYDSSSGGDVFDGESVSRTQGIDFSSELGQFKDYSVVISSNATATEKYAAEQLVKYGEQVIGKRLPIVNDELGGEAVISVGHTARLSGSGVAADAAELKNDGFVVKSKGKTLFLCGGGERGTLYAVYDFLEYFLGVKWLTADVTYIPENPTACVYKADRKEIPAFDYRIYLDPSTFYNDSTDFSTARRFTSEYLKIPENAGGNLKWYQGYDTHNSLQWVNVTNYVKNGKIDPLYTKAFSNDGHNVISEAGGGSGTDYAADLCYTDGINEDGSYQRTTIENGTERKTAVGMVIEGMCNVIANDKEENNYYMFGQSDFFSRPCLCADCVASASKYTDAGMMIRFINAVADGVKSFAAEKKIDREINIIMFAYQWSSYAPVEKGANGNLKVIDNTCIPNKNVVIRLAPINMNRFAAYDDEAQDSTPYGSDYMAKWSAVSDNFMVWEYATNNARHYWWYPVFSVWNSKLNVMKNMGVKYVMLQSNYQERTVYQTILESYVASKMLWNPDYDVYELIFEFNKYYFGEEAAEYVDKYIMLLTSSCYDALAKNGYRQSVGLAYCGKGTLKTALALLDSAENAAHAVGKTDKDAFIQRLEVVKFQPRYMYLYNYSEYETDQIQMNIEAKKFILDVMSAGGVYWAENQLFDAENVIFR